MLLLRELLSELDDILTQVFLYKFGHSHLTPSLRVNPFEFLNEFFIPKTRILGLSVGEDLVILACVVFTQCSYADAL